MYKIIFRVGSSTYLEDVTAPNEEAAREIVEDENPNQFVTFIAVVPQ
jgi:hypothetical protein